MAERFAESAERERELILAFVDRYIDATTQISGGLKFFDEFWGSMEDSLQPSEWDRERRAAYCIGDAIKKGWHLPDTTA